MKRQETAKNDVRRVPQLVYDLKKYYPRQFAEFQEGCLEMQQRYLEQYLEMGVSQGLVRADLNIKITAFLFAGLHSAAIRDFEKLEAHNHNMHQLGYTTMDILVRGILSEEGLKLYTSTI